VELPTGSERIAELRRDLTVSAEAARAA
jgi:hypothetical protein